MSSAESTLLSTAWLQEGPLRCSIRIAVLWSLLPIQANCLQPLCQPWASQAPRFMVLSFTMLFPTSNLCSCCCLGFSTFLVKSYILYYLADGLPPPRCFSENFLTRLPDPPWHSHVQIPTIDLSTSLYSCVCLWVASLRTTWGWRTILSSSLYISSSYRNIWDAYQSSAENRDEWDARDIVKK